MQNKILQWMRAKSRRIKLEQEYFVGRPRATSWGGKPDAKKDRRESKKELKQS